MNLKTRLTHRSSVRLKQDLQALHARNQKLQERLDDAIADKIQMRQELDEIHHGIDLRYRPSRGFFSGEDINLNLSELLPIDQMTSTLMYHRQGVPGAYQNPIVTNTSRLAYVLMGEGADNALAIAFRIIYMIAYLDIDISHISVLTGSEHCKERISHHLSTLLPLFVNQHLCDDAQDSLVQTLKDKLTQCIDAVHDNMLMSIGIEFVSAPKVNDTGEIDHLFNRYGAINDPVRPPDATWRKFKCFAYSMRHILISDFDSTSDAAIKWMRFYLNYSVNHLRNGRATCKTLKTW